MGAGRPLKYETAGQLQADIDAYFHDCIYDKDGNKRETQKHLTISGLAIALDVDRKTITNYESREEYFPTIKRAKTIIENYMEEKLFGNNVTGVIFNLKNNFGWKDKKEHELSSDPDKPLKWETTYVKADVDKGNDK